jgi:hypothetical protein
VRWAVDRVRGIGRLPVLDDIQRDIATIGDRPATEMEIEGVGPDAVLAARQPTESRGGSNAAHDD